MRPVGVVMPVAKWFRPPLPAAYRTGMAGFIQDRVAEGGLRRRRNDASF